MTYLIEPAEEYKQYAPRWQKIRDILDGEDRLKSVDLSRWSGGSQFLSASITYANNQYLRDINPTEKSAYNTARNQGYIKGARLYAASGRTHVGLTGMLFRSPAVKPDVPGIMEYIFDNVDGAGLSMEQQAQEVGSDVVAIGRDGLLVDMPRNDSGQQITVADVEGGFRPTIQEYKTESIWFWHTKNINGSPKLDVLVLREVEEELDPGDDLRLTYQNLIRYRVYRLIEGFVTVEILIERDGAIESGEQTIVMFGSEPAKEIPFVFVGSKNNTPRVDKIPLEDLANVNIGDYQESANLASSSYQLGAPN